MTILPLVDCEIVSTNVVDNTAVFNNNIQQNYPLGTRYQENNNIYENMGADIIVPAYDVAGAYTVGQILYKDSKVNKCTATSGEFIKQPEEYTATDTSFDDSVWANRYMKIADITANLPIDGKSVQLPYNYFSMFFNPDKTKLYTATWGNEIKQYSLTTAGDIGTATYESSQMFSSYGYIIDMFFNPTGTKLYIYSNDLERIVQFTLSTAWDITTATYSTYKTSHDIDVKKFTLSSDGTKLYQVSGYYIYQSTLSTAWNISTAGSTTATKLLPYTKDITFSDDGTKMYLAGNINGTFLIEQWNLSTAWSISTAAFHSGSNFQVDFMQYIDHIHLATDGTEMFVRSSYSKFHLYRIVLATAWDITTARYTPFPLIHTETRDAIVYEYSITKSGTIYTFESKKAGVPNSQTLTVFTELNYSSVEEKAYIGSNGTWVAKTLIIRPTAIYIRTSIDKSIEYKTLTAYQFSIVTSPTELTGFSYIEKTNPYKPFDNKSYTVATIDNTMTYRIKALSKMDAVVLAHLKGTSVGIKFYDVDNVLQSEIVDYITDGSIDDRDEHPHEYTTEIFYNMPNGVRATIDTGGFIEVEITDTNIELGTLAPCLSIDAGYTDLEMEYSINDYSPYEVGIGGVVDYVEGITTIKGNVTFYERTTNGDKSVRRMLSLKKKVVAIDGGNSMNRTPNPDIALFNSTKILGRFDSISMKTMTKNSKIDSLFKVTATIMEVS